MSPKKRTKNVNWPQYVTVSNGRIVFRPRIPKEDQERIRTDKSGFLAPPVKLGMVGDLDEVIIRAWVAAKEQISSTVEAKHFTINWLKDQYLKSRQFSELKPDTQRQYLSFLKQIIDHPVMINKIQATFGDIKVEQLTTPMLRRIYDKRLKEYQEKGQKGTTNINRQFAALSAVLGWGIEFIDDLGIKVNPCKGIRKKCEPQKSRYVTDQEYDTQYKIASEVADWLPVFFEHAYLLAARSVEVRNLLLSNVIDEGYDVSRRKGSKDTVILWSDRLRKAYKAAKDLNRSRQKLSLFMITNSKGDRVTKHGLQSAMSRLKKLMKKKDLSHIFWTMHDLKRKGVSDSKDKRIAGHKTVQMQERYNVKKEAFLPPR